ncbi:Hypothetical protein A7982_04031 [Minicystis rosea]|nr:Hypothetical protein A7982_04031 [Minicystis rosea]
MARRKERPRCVGGLGDPRSARGARASVFAATRRALRRFAPPRGAARRLQFPHSQRPRRKRVGACSNPFGHADRGSGQ